MALFQHNHWNDDKFNDDGIFEGENSYHSGFKDGVEDTFTRVIKYLKSELKKNYTDQVQSFLRSSITHIEKMKNRTS